MAASRARLDLEVLERWIEFLAKEPKHFPFLVPWQEMIADAGGTEERAQELADGFQRLVLEVVAEQKKLEERNEKIIAKGTPLEDVKSTPMPNGFESFFDEHHVHDLHATILYLMGIDHTKLTYNYSGRDFRLTDGAGNVVHDIIA